MKVKRGRRPRTRSDDAIQWLRENGGTLDEAGSMFGLTRQAVSWRWLKLYPNEVYPHQEAQGEIVQARRDRIKALALEEKSILEISEITGNSYSVVAADLRRIGIKARDGRAIGQERLDQAAAAVGAGECLVDVAKRFEISIGYLAKIARDKGISAVRAHPGRRDGRTAKAARLVIKRGITMSEAARIMSCAPGGVSLALKKLKKR